MAAFYPVSRERLISNHPLGNHPRCWHASSYEVLCQRTDSVAIRYDQQMNAFSRRGRIVVVLAWGWIMSQSRTSFEVS